MKYKIIYSTCILAYCIRKKEPKILGVKYHFASCSLAEISRNFFEKFETRLLLIYENIYFSLSYIYIWLWWWFKFFDDTYGKLSEHNMCKKLCDFDLKCKCFLFLRLQPPKIDAKRWKILPKNCKCISSLKPSLFFMFTVFEKRLFSSFDTTTYIYFLPCCVRVCECLWGFRNKLPPTILQHLLPTHLRILEW